MSNKLERLFNKVSKKTSKDGGKQTWNNIKYLLPEGKCDQWNLSDEMKKHILSTLFPVKNILDKPNESESHHFLRQHARLTVKDPTIIHIIQIGYNISQFQRNPDPILVQTVKYYEHKLNEIETYISQDNLEKLSKMISDDVFNDINNYLDSTFF